MAIRSLPLSSRSAVLSLVSVLFLLLPACGKNDTTPTGPITVTSPTPTPQPTATPPVATNPVLPQSCRSLPASNGSSSGCAKRTGNFFNRVKDAVNATYGAPYRDPFTGASFEIVDGSNRIKVASAYLKAVTDALDRQGICALYDGEEIWVSDGGGFNEHYDIITAEGFSWVSYSVTCSPAVPMPALRPAPPARDPDCRSLPPSEPTFCTHEPSSTYDGDVWDAQDQLVAEDRARATRQIFNFNERFNDVYGYRIVDEPLYISELLKKIKAKGFCTIYDGDEFLVKRNNVFTEHMDMIRSDGFAIRNYISTCRDAAF